MKIVYIDIETTGLDPDKGEQILEIGAVIEDTKDRHPIENLPKFHCYIHHKQLTGSLYALTLNSKIIKTLSEWESFVKENYEDYKHDFYRTEFSLSEDTIMEKLREDFGHNVLKPEEVTEKFLYFLNENDIDFKNKITFGGKNVLKFDIPFLQKTIPGWTESIKNHLRAVDPAMLYVDWENDNELPSLKTIKERLDDNSEVRHTGIGDCIDTLLTVRMDYNRKRIWE